MQIGRRKAIFITFIIGVIGISITMKLNFYMVVAGRFLYGFSGGLISVICPRFLEETVPSHLYTRFAPFINVFSGCGQQFGFMIGAILPPDNEKVKLAGTEKWRVIYFYFPLGLFIIAILAFTFIIKHDSIKNLITNGKIKEAREHLCLVYKHCKMDTNVDEYLNFIKSKCSKGSTGLTICDSLKNPLYRTATWINIGYIVFHEITGINIVTMYSNTILKNMNKSGSVSLTPR
jgi:MFS family permease